MSLQNSESPSWCRGADRLAATWQDFLLLAARVLIGWIFLSSGFGKLMNISAFAATMPRRGLPEFLGYIAPFVEFFGGAFLVAGLATRYTALLMLLFMLFATFSSHRYWSYPEAQQANQNSHFWKNVAITGGIVLLFITGAGRYALDAMLGRRRS
ncbi:MAG: DoxX family protein [Pseudomonadota bacterium]